jgi:hypothetical protein
MLIFQVVLQNPARFAGVHDGLGSSRDAGTPAWVDAGNAELEKLF